MSYNFNVNRHNSVGGNWQLPPLLGYSGTPPEGFEPNQANQNTNQGQQLKPQLSSPGFRNPWYSPTNSSSGTMNSSSPGLLGSPTKSQIPLLQQQQQQNKRLSFANQLPTTYEDDQKQQQVPFIHPPTRVENPFNQYYTNQEVTLDRRMSAAVDGPQYYENYQNAQQFPTYVPQLGPSVNTRRSSVAVGGNYPTHDTYYQQQHQNLRNGPPGRSPLVVQYQQYLQQQGLHRKRPAPRANKIFNKLDLKPKIHHQPKYRRCLVNSIHISPLNALTVYLTESYGICQPRKFQYSKATNPRRVLTKPLDPKFNNGFDNEDSDYILYVNDILGTEEGRKYMVLDLLGLGTFGQVVKCQNLSNQSVCAVKVIKSKPAYVNQSLTEKRILEFLNANSDGTNFIRLLDTFMHKEHLCLVFELLASNLYELIKQNRFQGLNIKLVRMFTKQLLESLAQLKGFQMIHCDLKPENILLCQADKPDIKVIDFGLACFTRQTIYTYIQSRFYRSPEIILGLPYTESIDMWSLGCIVGELFLGLPMFPSTSEYNQIWKIVHMLGNPPRHMIEVGRNALNFFKKVEGEGKHSYEIKDLDEYAAFVETSREKDSSTTAKAAEQPNKDYFKHRYLKDIITNYQLPSKKMTNLMIEKEYQERTLLIDFLTKVLTLNPLERLTPQEALKHPFVTEK